MTCCGARKETLTLQEKSQRLRVYYEMLKGKNLRKNMKKKNER